jgi:hypothetical protein
VQLKIIASGEKAKQASSAHELAIYHETVAYPDGSLSLQFKL